MVDEAREREIPLPAIESPLAAPDMRLTLLLKRVQSPPVRAHVVELFAVAMVNTPVRLLYERGQTAERDVSPIFVATTHERVLTVPDRLKTVHERERKLVVRVLTDPERLKRVPERERRFVFKVFTTHESENTVHERERMFPVAVAR